MANRIFSPEFRDRLISDGWDVLGIEAEAEKQSTIRSRYKAAHDWLDNSYPHRFLHRGLYNQQRDGILPQIVGQIEEILEPWKQTRCTDYLPVITLKELGRRVRMHPRRIFKILSHGSPTFEVGDEKFELSMTEPNSLPRNGYPPRRWQQLCSERDQQFFCVKLSFASIHKQDYAPS